MTKTGTPTGTTPTRTKKAVDPTTTTTTTTPEPPRTKKLASQKMPSPTRQLTQITNLLAQPAETMMGMVQDLRAGRTEITALTMTTDPTTRTTTVTMTTNPRSRWR